MREDLCMDEKMGESMHLMRYYDGKGRTVELYLCCFCKAVPDLRLQIRCEHFHLLSGKHCPCFVSVEDQARRIDELLSAKYDAEAIHGT